MIRKGINNDFSISLKRLFIKKPKDKNQSRKFLYNLKDRNQLAAEHAIWTVFTHLLLNRKASSLPPDHQPAWIMGRGLWFPTLLPGGLVQGYSSPISQCYTLHKAIHPLKIYWALILCQVLSWASGTQRTGRYSLMIRREAFLQCERSRLAPATIWSTFLGAASLPTLFYPCLLL